MTCCITKQELGKSPKDITVELVRGKWVFCKNGAYFALDLDQVEQMNRLTANILNWEKGDGLEDKLEKIRQWCDAYPLDIFPEPDFKKAAEVLKNHGMTIDAISASNMRHVLTGIKRIIDEGETG